MRALHWCFVLMLFEYAYSQGNSGGNSGGSVSKSAVPPRVHQVLIIKMPVLGVANYDVLELDCSASGNPIPTIEWSHDGVRYEKGEQDARHIMRGSSLIINKVNKKDSGRFRCIATNEFGSVFVEKKN